MNLKFDMEMSVLSLILGEIRDPSLTTQHSKLLKALRSFYLLDLQLSKGQHLIRGNSSLIFTYFCEFWYLTSGPVRAPQDAQPLLAL